MHCKVISNLTICPSTYPKFGRQKTQLHHLILQSHTVKNHDNWVGYVNFHISPIDSKTTKMKKKKRRVRLFIKFTYYFFADGCSCLAAVGIQIQPNREIFFQSFWREFVCFPLIMEPEKLTPQNPKRSTAHKISLINTIILAYCHPPRLLIWKRNIQIYQFNLKLIYK